MSNLSLNASLISNTEEPISNGGRLEEASMVADTLFGLTGTRCRRAPSGRVNETFILESDYGQFVLQRLNDFFQASEAPGSNWLKVWLAIKERSGRDEVPLPPIYSDLKNRILAPFSDGGLWRLTGFLDGIPADKSPAGAESSARLMGRIHRYLNEPAPLPELLALPDGEFNNQRLSRPEDFMALISHYRGHPHLDNLKSTIEQAAEASWHLPARPEFLFAMESRSMVIHGDPKADNFLLDQYGQAEALLDWDSVCYGHNLIDIAEMLRSWGAPGKGVTNHLNLLSMGLIIKGYGETGPDLSQTDLEILPAVLRAITLNLCRRYLTDALAEVYFKLDKRNYRSLYEQNKSRAGSMLSFAESLLTQEFEIIDLFLTNYRTEQEH